MTIKEIIKEDIDVLPDHVVGVVREFILFQKFRLGAPPVARDGGRNAAAFHVNPKWLEGQTVKPGAKSSEDYIREERDSRG